jgi:hypothetical protein
MPIIFLKKLNTKFLDIKNKEFLCSKNSKMVMVLLMSDFFTENLERKKHGKSLL